MRRDSLLVSLLILSVGCSAPERALRSTSYDFAGARATIRDFPPGAICEAEPRFLLDEISAVNGLLLRYVRAVPADGARWSDEEVRLSEEALERLPPLLEVHAVNLAGLERCPFRNDGAWPSIIARGHGLVREARAGLNLAPAALRAERAARAREAWEKTRFEEQEAARRSCPVRIGQVVIYHAWRDGNVTTWLFCDGARVARAEGKAPEFEPSPAEFSRGRRPDTAKYLAAVERFPAEAVARAPTAP